MRRHDSRTLTPAKRIEALIAKGRTTEARKLIRAELRKKVPQESDRHFYLARLALTYSMDGKYGKALERVEQATRLAPWCVMAAEVRADILLGLGREQEAIGTYRIFVKRGADYIARSECGEGIASARRTVADSLYGIAWAYESLGKRRRAIPYLERHLARREEGYASRLPLREAREWLADLKAGGGS